MCTRGVFPCLAPISPKEDFLGGEDKVHFDKSHWSYQKTETLSALSREAIPQTWRHNAMYSKDQGCLLHRQGVFHQRYKLCHFFMASVSPVILSLRQPADVKQMQYIYPYSILSWNECAWRSLFSFMMLWCFWITGIHRKCWCISFAFT